MGLLLDCIDLLPTGIDSVDSNSLRATAHISPARPRLYPVYSATPDHVAKVPISGASDIEKGFRYRKRVSISKKGSGIEKGFRCRSWPPLSEEVSFLRMYLASYFTPGLIRIGMEVFPSAGTRGYAYSGLCLVVDPGAGTAQSHVHGSLHCFDHKLATTDQ